MPPGGPPDTQAPNLLSITPDTGTVHAKSGAAVFQFDEVVSERPAGVTNLGDLFVVSPRQGVPNVAWHRESISVKPRRGWLPNTTYTITMLPGIADLRGNVRNKGVTTYFSTGSAIDKGMITGSVYDLIGGNTAANAIVEARTTPDTTVAWIARADSSGVFRLEHLPQRTFLVRAYVDKNRNFGADPGEASDTATVTAGDSIAADFFVVAADSVAPRLVAANESDSLTLSVSFDRPSDSASAVAAGNYRILGADSTTIPIASVAPPTRDTTRKRLTTKRAIPLIAVRITLVKPLDGKKQYRLRAVGITGLLGQSLPSEIAITRQVAPAPSGKKPPPPLTPTKSILRKPIKNE